MTLSLLGRVLTQLVARVRGRTGNVLTRVPPRFALELPQAETLLLSPSGRKRIVQASSLYNGGDADAALDLLAALVSNEASALARAVRGMLLAARSRQHEADDEFHAARAADAGLAGRLYSHAEREKSAGRHEAAIPLYIMAAQIEAANPRYATRLADTLYISGEHDQAREWLGRAHRSEPRDALRLKDVIMRLSPVYRSAAQLREARQSYLVGLEELSRQQLRIDNPFGEINFTNFYLAYQGMNERESQALLGRTLLAAAPMLGYQSEALERPRKGGPLRVGFISRYLGRHSVGMCYNKLIGALAADPQLEVSVALLSARRAPEARELIGEAAQIMVLPGDLQGIRQALSACALDVLIFTDIGMEPSTYLLAFGRYARLQGVLAGHPITTGIPTIDFFLSSHANEASAAQEHYTERLVRLQGLPVAIAAPPQLPPASRASMGLADDAHLYLCPLKLQKMHPDFDAALAGILEADPAALILLFDDDARSRWGAVVRERLIPSLGDHAQRVRFLPWMPFGELLQLIAASDVVLDTFHFGAGTTAYYALMAGAPVVTLPAPYLRGRHTLGYCAKIGLHDCVARDAAEYVRIAVQVASDSDYQRALKARIAARRGELADCETVSREFAAFLLEG